MAGPGRHLGPISSAPMVTANPASRPQDGSPNGGCSTPVVPQPAPSTSGSQNAGTVSTAAAADAAARGPSYGVLVRSTSSRSKPPASTTASAAAPARVTASRVSQSPGPALTPSSPSTPSTAASGSPAAIGTVTSTTASAVWFFVLSHRPAVTSP